MTKKWLISMLGAAAMTVSAGALAQAPVPGFYAGLEVGQADFGSVDDIGFKILGGYQFHRNIAAEIGYGMLLDKDGVEVNALELVAVGTFPLMDRLSLMGKLGFANVDADPGDSKTELTFGIGLQYDVSRNLSARLFWQRYDTETEIDFIGVGALWRF